MDIEWVWIFRNKTWILFKSSDHITLATYAMNLAPYSSASRFFLNTVFVIIISFDDDSPLLWLYTLWTLSSYVPSLLSFS
ncbi:hypothetical protein Hanom_Chr03g00257941 [Helianthus anomalus]